MEEDPRSSGKVAVQIMDEITEDSVPSSATVVEDIENPAATAKIEENIKEYCIKIDSFLQTLEQSPKADAGVSAFFRVPPHMHERGRGELLYDPKYINFSQIRSMLLNPMPDDKERKLLSHYYRHLQSILENNKKGLTDCMEMMNKLKPEIIPENCYPVQDNLQKSVFSVDYPYLLGLLLSGCFIIDLFHRWYMSQLSPAYDQECGGIWASELWVDLLLVENQIPFFILQRIQETMPYIIYGTGKYYVKSGSLEVVVFTFYNDFLPLKRPKKVNQPTEQFHHLLHFVHRSLLPGIKEEQFSCTFWARLGFLLFSLCIILPLLCIIIPCLYIGKCLANLGDRTAHLIASDVTCACCSVGCFLDCFDNIAPLSWKVDLQGDFRTSAVLTTAVPTARRLQEAGVQFKPVKEKGLVVEFKRGVLWLPRLHVRSNTYKCFMNLIAWEQCYPRAGKYFTNFVIFMDYLINDYKDVEVLIESGVLEHSLSSDDEVVQVFNKLGKDLVYAYDEEYDILTELSRKLNNYCENRFNIWRANLMNEYFKSPWTIISVFAALFVILLTAVQTFFAVFSYFRPPN